MRRIGFKRALDRRGNVALVTALLSPLLVLIAGGAIDVTNAAMRQSQLQSAADAAAIAAVARNSAAYADAVNTPYSSGTTTLTDPAIAQQTQAVFNADLQNTHDATPVFNVVVTKTGTTVSSVVTATSSYAPAFLGLIGRNSIALAATSNASDNIPAYMNFYMLLDNTPSMGLGATQSDINNILVASVNSSYPSGCSFSCHATANSSQDIYDMIKSYDASHGVTTNMRIDVVRQSTQQLTQTAYNTEQVNGIQNEFQMAVYDFGTAAIATPTQTQYSLHQDSPLSAALTTTVYNNANAVDLMQVPGENSAYTSAGPPPAGSVNNNDEDTSFDYTMTQLGNIMVPVGSTGGNGSTAQSPVPILFMVTDGMTDQYVTSGGNCASSNRVCGAINPATCAALKSRGIIIAILYTTYSQASVGTDQWSVNNIYPVLPNIQPQLQACSSGSNYFQPVTPTGGISQAMQNLFQSVVAQVRITR